MSGFLYRGRDCEADKTLTPRSIGPEMDVCRTETDKGPPPQSHSLRDFEQHLSDLKKENFSLKLRIYFLEERVQDKSESTISQDLTKTNIELKVELQTLKKELEEKQQLLHQALSTAELLSNQRKEELQRRDNETTQLQEGLEAKIQQLQQEADTARAEAQRVTDSETQRCLEKELQQSETSDNQLSRQALDEKNRQILELTSEKHRLELKVRELNSALRKRPHSAESRLAQRDHSQLKRVMEEQSDQLIHYETAPAQCLTELQTAQNQVQTLQSKIQLSEDSNQRLQRRLTELELELRSVQEEAQEQERNLQNVTDSLCSRDSEAAELYRVIEEQNKMLCSLKETTHSHTQVSSGEEVSFQSELLSLQLALFRSQLDLEALDRVQRNKDRTEADLRRSVERLKQDLQEALQQSRDTREHNQELQSDLDQTRAALRDREDELKKVQTQNQRQNQVKNRTISELKAALGRKEQLIQDYSQLLDSKENQDSVIFKLRKSIEKRDQALERVVEEQLQRLQQEEQEKLQLQELLRDKQNDLQTQTQVLLHNQDTIKTLEVLVRGRTLELERLSESLRKSGLKQNQVQTELNRIIAEKDGLIRTLQTGLREFTQEAQELRQAHASLCPSNVLQQLQLRLQLKDRLLQEVMSDRTRQTQDQLEQVQELVRTLDLRDQYIQDSSPRFLELLKEQSDRIKDLRKNLLSPGLRPDQDQVWTLKDQLRQAQKRDQENQDQVRQVQRDLEEKDQVIKKLVAELQDLRGGLRADAAPEQSLVLGLERAEGGVESGGGAHSQSIMGHSSLM